MLRSIHESIENQKLTPKIVETVCLDLVSKIRFYGFAIMDDLNISTVDYDSLGHKDKPLTFIALDSANTQSKVRIVYSSTANVISITINYDTSNHDDEKHYEALERALSRQIKEYQEFIDQES
jgi:hypothetical protein